MLGFRDSGLFFRNILICYAKIKKIKCSRINMDTAAGGSGDDGRGNHRFSACKEKTQVNPQPKPRKKKGRWREQ